MASSLQKVAKQQRTANEGHKYANRLAKKSGFQLSESKRNVGHSALLCPGWLAAP